MESTISGLNKNYSFIHLHRIMPTEFYFTDTLHAIKKVRNTLCGLKPARSTRSFKKVFDHLACLPFVMLLNKACRDVIHCLFLDDISCRLTNLIRCVGVRVMGLEV